MPRLSTEVITVNAKGDSLKDTAHDQWRDQWGQTRLIFHRDHQSLEILGPADQAQYHAKRHGQNLAYCYDHLMASGALPAARVAQGDVEMF